MVSPTMDLFEYSVVHPQICSVQTLAHLIFVFATSAQCLGRLGGVQVIFDLG